MRKKRILTILIILLAIVVNIILSTSPSIAAPSGYNIEDLAIGLDGGTDDFFQDYVDTWLTSGQTWQYSKQGYGNGSVYCGHPNEGEVWDGSAFRPVGAVNVHDGVADIYGCIQGEDGTLQLSQSLGNTESDWQKLAWIMQGSGKDNGYQSPEWRGRQSYTYNFLEDFATSNQAFLDTVPDMEKFNGKHDVTWNYDKIQDLIDGADTYANMMSQTGGAINGDNIDSWEEDGAMNYRPI